MLFRSERPIADDLVRPTPLISWDEELRRNQALRTGRFDVGCLRVRECDAFGGADVFLVVDVASSGHALTNQVFALVVPVEEPQAVALV